MYKLFEKSPIGEIEDLSLSAFWSKNCPQDHQGEESEPKLVDYLGKPDLPFNSKDIIHSKEEEIKCLRWINKMVAGIHDAEFAKKLVLVTLYGFKNGQLCYGNGGKIMTAKFHDVNNNGMYHLYAAKRRQKGSFFTEYQLFSDAEVHNGGYGEQITTNLIYQRLFDGYKVSEMKDSKKTYYPKGFSSWYTVENNVQTRTYNEDGLQTEYTSGDGMFICRRKLDKGINGEGTRLQNSLLVSRLEDESYAVSRVDSVDKRTHEVIGSNYFVDKVEQHGVELPTKASGNEITKEEYETCLEDSSFARQKHEEAKTLQLTL